MSKDRLAKILTTEGTYRYLRAQNVKQKEREKKQRDINWQLKRFEQRIRSAYIGSRDLNLLLGEKNVASIEGLGTLFLEEGISDLLQELRKTLTFLGFDYKNIQLKR